MDLNVLREKIYNIGIQVVNGEISGELAVSTLYEIIVSIDWFKIIKIIKKKNFSMVFY